jgi:predicted nucleic acid-binding protein
VNRRCRLAQLIHSSVLIALERRQFPLERLAAFFPGALLAIAAITVSELLVGVHLADTPERRRQRLALVDAVLDLVEPIPFDVRAARAHAGLWADLRRSGVAIGAHDLQIAATALANGHELVTANPRDFGRVPGLVVRAFTPPD